MAEKDEAKVEKKKVVVIPRTGSSAPVSVSGSARYLP